MRYRDIRNGRVCQALVITKDTMLADITYFVIGTKVRQTSCSQEGSSIVIDNMTIPLRDGDTIVKYKTEIDVLYKEEFEENFEEIQPKKIRGCECKGCSHNEGERGDTISIDLTFGGDFDKIKFTDEMKEFAIREMTKAIREQGR